MVSLIKLLEQSLLTEGRVEDVLKKYQGKITPETVNKFVEAQNKIDPSINNKYLDWMASAFVAGGSTDQIINAVDVWHKNINKIDKELISNRYPDFMDNPKMKTIVNNPKDINSYGDLQTLIQVGKDASNKLSKGDEDKIISSETRLVYQDNQYQIRVPLTHRASCKYGRGTAWCTRLPDTDSYFKSYTKDGVLFYIIDKTIPSRVEHPMYKVAVLMDKQSGSSEVFNARDKMIGHDLNYFFPPEMIEAMKAYLGKYVIDLNSLSITLNKKLGLLNGEVQSWKLTNLGEKTGLVNGNYFINLLFNLKNNILNLSLQYQKNNIASYNLQISGELIKDVEDIVVEHGSNDYMLQQWLNEILNVLDGEWVNIMKQFQPIMTGVEIHDIIGENLKKVTGNWVFSSETVPSENNNKSVFKSVRTIPVDGEDYTYTLILVLDMMKSQFVFKAEEMKSHSQKEQYEDQITPFDKKLINKPNTLIKEYLDWVQEIVSAVYDEDWQELGDEGNGSEIKNISGKYSSDRSGNFTIEVDADNKIHVYSEKTNSHYLINSYKQFISKVVEPYGLKKIK